MHAFFVIVILFEVKPAHCSSFAFLFTHGLILEAEISSNEDQAQSFQT